MSQPFPYYYRAYGLNIESEIPVIGMDAESVLEPDVTIVEGKVPDKLEVVFSATAHFQSNETELLFSYKPVGMFYVTNGNKIILQRSEGVKDADLSSVILGICFGAVLHQRKLLPLHASTVIYKNKCLLFVGKSGAGKSTMALSIIKAGGMLIADDVSVVSFFNDIPAVIPAFPAIKIWADSLNHFGITPKGLLSVRDEIDKFYFPVDRFLHKPALLDNIIVLGTHNGANIDIHAIEGFEKFRLLKQYTYLFRNIPGTDHLINHFQLVSNLSSKIPVSRLNRPKTGFDTNNLLEIMIKHCWK